MTVFNPFTLPIEPIRPADGEQRIRHVFVRDLLLEADIGVYARERGAKQRVRINVDLAATEGEHPLDDRIEHVLCYQGVVDKIVAILDAGHINLVETLAERIADAALDYTEVRSVQVRVEKLDAVAAAASVGVAIERRKTPIS